MKVCSTTFLSLSWSKLLSGKYWFSRTLNRRLNWFLSGGNRFNQFLHCSPFWKILVQPDTQPDTQPVFVWWKQVQPVLKQVQPVFALFTFFCQSAVSAKKLYAAFWKPVQPVFGQKSQQRLVLEPHLYILTPTSLPTEEHAQNFIPNLRNTSHSLSHTSCLSHFKSLERNLWVRLRAVVFLLHLHILLALPDSSFGATSSSLWIHYSWSF